MGGKRAQRRRQLTLFGSHGSSSESLDDLQPGKITMEEPGKVTETPKKMTHFPFFNLPTELRIPVYEELFSNTTGSQETSGAFLCHPQILAACEQTHNEAAGLFHDATSDVGVTLVLDMTSPTDPVRVLLNGTNCMRVQRYESPHPLDPYVSDALKMLSWPPWTGKVTSLNLRVVFDSDLASGLMSKQRGSQTSSDCEEKAVLECHTDDLTGHSNDKIVPWLTTSSQSPHIQPPLLKRPTTHRRTAILPQLHRQTRSWVDASYSSQPLRRSAEVGVIPKNPPTMWTKQDGTRDKTGHFSRTGRLEHANEVLMDLWDHLPNISKLHVTIMESPDQPYTTNMSLLSSPICGMAARLPADSFTMGNTSGRLMSRLDLPGEVKLIRQINHMYEEAKLCHALTGMWYPGRKAPEVENGLRAFFFGDGEYVGRVHQTKPHRHLLQHRETLQNYMEKVAHADFEEMVEVWTDRFERLKKVRESRRAEES